MFDESLLTTVPNQSELHHWADYLEIACLTDPEGHFTVDRLAQVAKFAEDLAATSPDAQDPEDVAELHDSADAALLDLAPEAEAEAEDVDEEGNAETEAVGYEDFGRAAEVTDNRFRWCQNLFRLLKARADSLGESYPFEVDRRLMSVSLLERTAKRSDYVFYLCCSSLRYVPADVRASLTKHFELVSYEVLSRILPTPPAVIDLYGTARPSRPSQFVGSPYERLVALAEELRGKVVVSPADFHPRDHADNGLDIVAWIPMGDPTDGVPVFLAQCACGVKWEGKQYEASHERWRKFLLLSPPSTAVTLIPYYFRKPGDHWYANSDVSGMLVDRLRALRLAHRTGPLPVPTDLVDRAWASRVPAA